MGITKSMTLWLYQGLVQIEYVVEIDGLKIAIPKGSREMFIARSNVNDLAILGAS